MARRYWREAGVEQKIELRIGPAAETLMSLLAEGHGESFDMAFIDADKTGYDTYYELSLQLVRPGGVIVLDNMLREGNITDPSSTDPDTLAIRALNQKLGRDSRVISALLSIADGVTLAWKKIGVSSFASQHKLIPVRIFENARSSPRLLHGRCGELHALCL